MDPQERATLLPFLEVGAFDEPCGSFSVMIPPDCVVVF